MKTLVVAAPAEPVIRPCRVSQRHHAAYATRVYKRPSVGKAAKQRLRRMRGCAASVKAQRKMRKFEAKAKVRKANRPAAFTIPTAIVMCESGGNWKAVNTSNPNRPAGAYQIITSTWLGYGGGRFAPTADAATPYEQGVVAARIYAGGAGRSHWAC